jgi:hypothetical protein
MAEKVAFATGWADITPRKPFPLGGYSRRTKVFEKIADQLEANILIARTDGDNEAIVVTLDLLYVGDALRESILNKLGLNDHPEVLFLAASHTHFAPMVQYGTPRLGMPDPEYVEFVASRVADMIKHLHSVKREVTATLHEGEADHSINRRLKRIRVTRTGVRLCTALGPNQHGERDESVRVCKLTDASGVPVVILWNYACHPTGYPGQLHVSADFPGIVRQRLRCQYGNIPILFFQGCSGDVRPPFVRQVRDLRSWLMCIMRGPRFGPPSLEEWKRWAESLATRIAGIAATQGKALHLESPSFKRTMLPVESVATGKASVKRFALHIGDFGDLCLLGIGAELVVRYRALLKEAVPSAKTFFTVSCIDQTHGYLPTRDMLPDGGYEVTGFQPAFDFRAKFKPELEQQVVEAFAKLLS